MDMYGVSDNRAPVTGWIRGSEPTFVVDPPRTLLADLVAQVRDRDGGTVRVLLSETVADELSDDFLLETQLEDAREHTDFSVRCYDGCLDDRLLLCPEDAGVVVPVADSVGIFETERSSFVADLQEKYEVYWSEATRLETRAPSRTQMREAASGRLSDAFVDDLVAAMDGARRLEWYGTPTPVELSLVVAGRADEHLYDVSRWGEDADFASRSSLSRSKNDLEEQGLVAIERDPQERGRPRQRLQAGDDELADAPAAELVSLIRQRLAE